MKFYEKQVFRPWWIWLIILPEMILVWYGWVWQIVLHKPFGTNPAPDWGVWLILFFCGILLPLAFYFNKMVTKVCDDEVSIIYFPFWRTSFKIYDVKKYRFREFQALKEFGGWGIRLGLDGTVAYISEGNCGVQFELKNGRKVLIGSKRSEELINSLRS